MGSLEGRVDPLSIFRPGDEPRRRAADRANWTCSIENGVGLYGTGVLIGPDLVLTNYHVIKGLLAEPERAGGARCRFDYNEDLESGSVSPGRWVNFAKDWAVVWTPYSARDEVGADSGFEPDHLDYAIIRLAAPIGTEPADGTSRARGWQTLPPDPVVPQKDTRIDIWQHPVLRRAALAPLEVQPLQWTRGKVLGLLDIDLRLRHDAQTLKGSSGAACFDDDYNFVALHHAGDPEVGETGFGKWNQAIPMAAIVRHLRSIGQAGLVGASPPPEILAPVPAKPAEREQQLAGDMAERRIRAATLLMDRDGPERDILFSRRTQDPNRAIVHVLACRFADSHRNFLKRVAEWTLMQRQENLDAFRTRLAAFLGAAGSREAGAWQRESRTWPTGDVSAATALEMMRDDIERFAKSGSRVMVEWVAPIDQVKLEREKRLVPALAKFCAGLADADTLQIFVVYYDPAAKSAPDRSKALRAALGGLWSLRDRPRGGGICLSLDEVGSVELESWSRALETVWRTPDGALVDDVESVFAARRMPMLDAEKRLVPVMRRRVAGEP